MWWIYPVTGVKSYIGKCSADSFTAKKFAKVDGDGKVTRQKVNFKSNLSTIDEGGFLGFILEENFNEICKI